MLGLFVAFVFSALFIPTPSDRLFDDVAQIGATLLIAFAIEASWLVKVSDRRSAKREEWIGFVSGLGVLGFSGVVASLALAEHIRSGHDNWLGHLGFAWVVSTLLALGLIVAIQPSTVYAWRQRGSLD